MPAFNASSSVGTQRPARAAPVLHRDDLAQRFGELLPDEARQDVRAAAGRERHDQADRPVGPRLRHAR